MYPSYGGYGGYGGGGFSSIPLDVRVPQMPNLGQYVGQMVSLQDAMQMRQLRQTEMQNQQLLAEQRQRQMDAEQMAGTLIAQNTTNPGAPPASAPSAPAPPAAAPSSSMAAALAPDRNPDDGTAMSAPAPAAPPAGSPSLAPAVAPPPPSPDQAYHGLAQQHQIGDVHGYPIVDWGRVEQGMAAHGYGSYYAKMDQERRANETAALSNQKTQLENTASKLNMVTQALSPLATAGADVSDDQKKQMWQTARNSLIQNGVATADQLPATYDKDLAQQLFSNGSRSGPILQEHAQFVDAMAKLNESRVKTEADKRDLANKLTANAQTPDDLQHAMLVARSAGFSDQDVAQLFPAQFSPDAKARAAAALVPPQDQARLQGEAANNAAPMLATAFRQGGYGAALQQLETQHPELKGRFPQNPKNADDIMHAGLSAQQSTMADYRSDMLDVRSQMADARQAALESENAFRQFREDHFGQSTRGNHFAQAAFDKDRQREEALHSQLINYYAQLQSGKDGKGNAVDPAATRGLIAATKDALQSKQWDKAEHMGITEPSGADVARMQENDTLPSENPGVVWKKMNGIVYPVGAQGATPAAPRTATPSPAPRPAAGPPPPPAPSSTPAAAPRPSPAPAPAPAPARKFSEADVRARARARGIDENAAVANARSKGLLQ